MKKTIHIIWLWLLFASCGIRMAQLELVDEWGNTYNKEKVLAFTDNEIFTNLTADVWGLEETPCKQFARIDSLSYKGKSSLLLQWNKTGNCPWLGFGIGWNGYAAKDLTPVMQNGNLTFYIRAIKGTQFIPTLIFLLEDYSGIQTASAFKAKYLERYPIDEQWQKVTIPLSTFLQAAAPLSDFSNIKSLNIECQGEGAIMIDEIYIEEGETKLRGKQEKFGETITFKFPAVVFDESMRFAWGLGNYKGRDISLDSQVFYNGKAALQINWNVNGLSQVNNQIGFNWERWQAIALPESMNSYKLTLFVYAPNENDLNNFEIGFESYTGEQVRKPLKSAQTVTEKHTDNQGRNWQKLTIPMAAFDWEASNFNTKKFKQLLVTFKNNGNVWIDYIQIEKQ